MRTVTRKFVGQSFQLKKAVFLKSDGTLTQELLLDGLGDVEYIEGGSAGSKCASKIGEGYYGVFTTKQIDSNYYIEIRIYKKVGTRFQYLKTVSVQDNTPSALSACYISTNKTLLAYKGANGYGRARLITFNPATESVTVSTDYIFLNGAITSDIETIKTEDNRALIVFGNNSGNLTAVVATYVDPDILFGVSVQLNTSQDSINIRIIELSAEKFVIASYQGGTTKNIQLTLVSVSGTTISTLRNQIVASTVNTFNSLEMVKINNSKGVIATSHSAANPNYIQLVPFTVDDGDNFVIGTAYNMQTDGADSYKGGIPFYDSVNKKLYVMSPYKFIFCYDVDENALTFTLNKKVDYPLRFPYIRPSESVDTTQIIKVSENEWIGCIFSSLDLDLSGCMFVFRTDGFDRPQYMGIANGADTVLVEGLLTGLSGLKVGRRYHFDSNGNLILESNIQRSDMWYANRGVYDTFVGYAISDTELVLPKQDNLRIKKGVIKR